MDFETKYATIDASAVTDEGLISGYASLFNLRDQGGDIVLPGAYAKSLTERSPKMFWAHDQTLPIGVWLSVEEDAVGLRVSGKLALDTIKGKETYSLLKMGAIDGLSIGFKAKKTGRSGSARLLQEVELHEISVVSLQMQREATVDQVKSIEEIITSSKDGDYSPLKRAVEGAMRDAGFPAWMAKAQAALAPQALSEGKRDASASEIAEHIRKSFRI